MITCSYCKTELPDKYQYEDHCLLACYQKCSDYEGAVEAAYKELEALWSFCGQGLEVTNWHLNGSTEPLDNFFNDNSCGALNKLRKLLGK